MPEGARTAGSRRPPNSRSPACPPPIPPRNTRATASTDRRRRFGWSLLAGGAFEGFRAGTYLYATLRGKLEVWAREVDALHLTGTEQVLDVGCGRGAVLLTVARRLTTGRAVGLDLWQAKDQSGNTEAAARRNADVEGLTDRVDLVTGNLRALPFDDASFYLVVSNLALHNVPDDADRATALAEAMRVLRPGGRLLLADALHTAAYAEASRAAGAAGAEGVEVRPLGPRVWFGGPWFVPTMVSARKP